MPSHSPKSFPLSYSCAVDVLSDKGIADDINDACSKLAEAMSTLSQRFSAVVKQMHTVDLQQVAPPLKPRWNTISKECMDLLGQYRANAGYISARLKLFCTVVLPVASRNTDRQSRRPYDEAMHVLQTYITISAEHASSTRVLVNRTMSLTRELVNFHTEFSQVVCAQMNSGQKEVMDLCSKTIDLEGQVRQVCAMMVSFQQPWPVDPGFAMFRVVAGLGRKTGRSRLWTQQLLSFPDDAIKVTKTFEALDVKRNEFAHAQYCAQVRSAQTNFLARVQTSISSIIADALSYFETSLTLFFALWLRLQGDCRDIAGWLKEPKLDAPVLSIYLETGKSLYSPLVHSLDIYINGLNALPSSQDS